MAATSNCCAWICSSSVPRPAKASATSRKPVWMDFSYCATWMFFCTFARSRPASSEPPAKIGTVIWGTKLQAPEPPSNRPPRLALAVPAEPVRLMVGKNAARAAPIFALAPFNWCSAARMSGRRASRSDGSPAGSVVGSMPSSSLTALSSAAVISGDSGWPTSSTSALRSCAACRVYCDRLRCAVRSDTSAWLRSSDVDSPWS
ncbi:hypothetical protein D9M68_655910 [compost metagenome]